MSPEGQEILQNLQIVAAERARRRADGPLDARVEAVKAYQHARFERTYADLLASPRYARPARFFLEDLYGPYDFSARDDQFGRVVPGLVRLFPHEVVETVVALSQLHALSETLDTRMAVALEPGAGVDAAGYVRCWQRACTAAERERQIALMLAVGQALDRYTRNPLLRHSLRMMRGPARAVGLGALQSFLETGFDTFKGMRGAADFLATIASRERALAARLFDPRSIEWAVLPTDERVAASSALGQLP
jgi:hypothetical protein